MVRVRRQLTPRKRRVMVQDVIREWRGEGDSDSEEGYSFDKDLVNTVVMQSYRKKRKSSKQMQHKKEFFSDLLENR